MVRPLSEMKPGPRSAVMKLASGFRRVGVVADYAEESWLSMDLAAELTALGLERHGDGAFLPTVLRPRMPRAGRRLPGLDAREAMNIDRYLGRYLAYPRWLRQRADEYDLFHVVDHSYAHLVSSLPAERTVVTCHDLDAFASLLGPSPEPRPWWFRRTMGRVLGGLRAAAHVICDTPSVRAALVEHGIVTAERSTVVPLPMHPIFGPDPEPDADAEAARLVRAQPGAVDLLHVGSTAPRKQIEPLLRMFAQVRSRHPHARLLRVGGALPAAAFRLADELGIGGALVELPFIDRRVLAAVYRRAALVVLPSLREGFGWPVLEAMACGTPVVASDIPPHREIGGEAVDYAPADDLQAWVETIDRVLRDRDDPAQWAGRREAALERAHAFSLEAYTQGVMDVYRRVLG